MHMYIETSSNDSGRFKLAQLPGDLKLPWGRFAGGSLRSAESNWKCLGVIWRSVELQGFWDWNYIIVQNRYKGPAIWREQFALWVLVWSISLESSMVWKLEVQKMWICFCIQTSQTGLRLSRLWITMCKRSRYRFKRNPCRCKQICCQIHLKAMCHCKFLNSSRLSKCHAVGSHGNSLQLLWWFHGFSCMPLSYTSQVFPSEQHHQCCTRHPCQWFCISCPCMRQIGQSEIANAWTSSVTKGWKSLDICRFFFLRGGSSIPRNHRGCACMFGAPVASLPWLEPFVTDSERPWREWTDIAWQNWFQDVWDKSVTQLIFQFIPQRVCSSVKSRQKFLSKVAFQDTGGICKKKNKIQIAVATLLS